MGEWERAATVVEADLEGPWLAVFSSSAESIFPAVTKAALCLYCQPMVGVTGGNHLEYGVC